MTFWSILRQRRWGYAVVAGVCDYVYYLAFDPRIRRGYWRVTAPAMLSWKIFASNWDWTSHCMYSFTATSATCFMVTWEHPLYRASGAGRVAYGFPGDAGVGLVPWHLIGIPLGILSAVWRNRWLDHLVRIMAITGISTPAFWLGLGVIVYAVWRSSANSSRRRKA